MVNYNISDRVSDLVKHYKLRIIFDQLRNQTKEAVGEIVLEGLHGIPGENEHVQMHDNIIPQLHEDANRRLYGKI